MKIFLMIFLMGNSVSAFALDKGACLSSAQELNNFYNAGLTGLGISVYYRKTVLACGIDEKACDNDEPGIAYYSYKASCILFQASQVLNR